MIKLIQDGLLAISDAGDIYRVLPNGERRELRKYGIGRGLRYRCVRPSIAGKQRTFYVHRLVAEAFLPNPEDLPQVNHIDGNPSNNNSKNLEWCTASHNIQHAYNTGLIDQYRKKRICASCGMEIADCSKSGLCNTCCTKLTNEKRFSTKLLFFGVVEFNKKVFGISNAGFAEMTGYSKETIDSFMCGKRVTSKIAKSLCKALNIDESLIPAS